MKKKPNNNNNNNKSVGFRVYGLGFFLILNLSVG